MKRIVSFALSLFCVLGMFSFAAFADDDDTLVDSGISYVDGCESFELNPGRGAGRYTWITAVKNGKTQSYTNHPTGLSTPMYDLSVFSAGNDFTFEGYASVKNDPGRVGGKNININDQTLETIANTFETASKKGVQCIPRFAYASDKFTGCEPDDIKWIIRHIEQLSEILNEYKHIVIGVDAGIIGPWGEMHTSKYTDKKYANQILEAWLENLDESIPVLCRNPSLILNYVGRIDIRFMKELPLTPDHPAYRLGMYNDGYLGSWSDYGTWGAGLNRENGIKFLSTQNQRMPYGGELAHTTVQYLKDNKSTIYDEGFIRELYDSHLTYLRNLTTNSTGIQEELSKMILAESMLDDGMPNLDEYLGKDLVKFIDDHMGYRFVIRKLELSSEVSRGRALRVRGSVENTGFGNLFGVIHTELLLVDEKGKKTYVPLDVDATDFKSCESTDFAFTVSVPEDAVPGEYKAYLRISAVKASDAIPGVRVVRLANPNIFSDSLNANYIGSFTVKEEVEGLATDFAQVHIDFSDIDRHCAKDDIRDICTLGYMNGMGGGRFAPDDVATRAQFVNVLYNIEGKPASEGSTPFADIDGWYRDAVEWAYNEGIVNGVSQTQFMPDKKLDRETFATMLYRYAKYKGVNVENARGDISLYADKDSVSSWALEAVLWANAKGYIKGMTAHTIVPQGKATRAQMATILYRYISDNR